MGKKLAPIAPGEILAMDYEMRRAMRDTWPAIEPRIRPIEAA
ncbi:MAG: hypothetical protein ACE5G9_02330 [Nitrospinales bacterium]